MAPPDAVLFACNLNRVRSPMAAALLRRSWGRQVYVDSCGLEAAESFDPFAAEAMSEIGLDLDARAPKAFEALEDGSFDLVICLTPEAYAHALELTRARATEVEYWPTPDPTGAEGSRAQRLELYRRLREELARRIEERFPRASTFGG